MTMYEKVQENLKQRPRNWLVTGAAGFIGSHLVENLLELNQNVVGLDNFSTGLHGNLDQIRACTGESRWRNFRFVEGDVRSLETCRNVCRGVDIVLHQAALGSVPRSIEDPLGTHESNVTGFINMLVATRGASVSRFVYAGSSAVYGDDPALPRRESQAVRPVSPYAVTKYVDELYADIFARCYGIETIGLRYFNVFGPRQDPNSAYAAVIPKWVASMIRNEPVYINGDGAISRDFCYIDNTVQANLLAAMSDDPRAVNQVYNVALDESTSLSELFTMIRSLLERRYPDLRGMSPLCREFRPGDVRLSRADIGKARRLLGYQPALRVQQGLEQAIDWYIANVCHDARPATAARGVALEATRG